MAAVDIAVELGLDLGSRDTQAMVLDDPVKGVLDGTYYLSGTVFYEITDRLISVSSNRGKSQALDRIDAGVLTIQAHNNDRAFDPLYAASPFAGALVPRRAVRVSANGYPVFTGFVDDIDIGYDSNRSSIASFQCSDAFSVLTNSNLDELVPALELPGARINTILNLPEVNWDTNLRDIDTGTTQMLDATIAQDTPALQYLQLVSDSEFGNLFLSKDGKITFRQRNSIPFVEAVTISDNKVGDVFTGIPYTAISVVYGSENLYNRITISNADVIPDEAVAEDADSQLYYGVRGYNKTGLLPVTLADMESLANFLLFTYSQPQYRFDTVSILLDDLSLADQAKVLGLEIGDVITIQFTPSQIPPSIEQQVRVIGINNNWRPFENVITFSLETVASGIFILDSADFGVLDTDRLSY
jgi:hypothetical protein